MMSTCLAKKLFLKPTEQANVAVTIGTEDGPLQQQRFRRLIRKPQIIPIKIQTDRRVMCTVVVKQLNPTSTKFVVTIPDT